MNANDYNSTLRRLDKETMQNLTDLATWAENDALPWLWNELAGIMPGKRVVTMKPHDAIRQGLQTTINDQQTMPLEGNFYVAQMTMMESEVKRYCIAAHGVAANQGPYAPATVHTLHRALKSCMSDGIVLFEQAADALLNLSTMYGAWSRRHEKSFEVFKGAEQVIYGTFSGLTHVDRAPFTPIAILRTAIELRIRTAFGIQGYVDQSNKSFVPIDLSQVLEQIKPRLKNIQFNVDLHDVIKIYKWSNFYLHAGWRDFVWVPGFTLQYLRPMFADPGKTPTGGWNIDGGIRMPRTTWREIRSAFEPAPQVGFIRTVWLTLKNLFSRKKARQLLLNDAEEKRAACVFLE